jgi:hypothetical protein
MIRPTGYVQMKLGEMVRHDGLESDGLTLLRSAGQVRGTAKSTAPALPGRAVRNAGDWQVAQGIHSRQGTQAAAIAMDIRSSRYQQTHADIVRASKNVVEWEKYLPEDCVKAMVASGWHFTV